MSASGLCVYISLFPRDSEQLTTGPWSHYSYISSIFSISRDQFKFTFYQNIFTLTRFVPAAHTITTSLLAAASIINQLWQERERGGRSQMLRGPQQWSSAHWYVTCGQSLHSTHPGGTPPHSDLSSNISNLLRVFLFVFRKLDRTIWKNLIYNVSWKAIITGWVRSCSLQIYSISKCPECQDESHAPTPRKTISTRFMMWDVRSLCVCHQMLLCPVTPRVMLV